MHGNISLSAQDAKRRTAELVGEGEDRKRVFTATQLYRAYTVDIETYPYFIDKRYACALGHPIGADNRRQQLIPLWSNFARLKQFEVEVNKVEDEGVWKECFSDLPWSRLQLYEKTMYLSALKLAGELPS